MNAVPTARQSRSAERRTSHAPPPIANAPAIKVSGGKLTSSAPDENATIMSCPVMPPASVGRYPSAAGTPNAAEIKITPPKNAAMRQSQPSGGAPPMKRQPHAESGKGSTKAAQPIVSNRRSAPYAPLAPIQFCGSRHVATLELGSSGS